MTALRFLPTAGATLAFLAARCQALRNTLSGIPRVQRLGGRAIYVLRDLLL